MWETSQGTRTLYGDEAYLIQELANYLHDLILVGIEIDEPHRSDVQLFDALQPTQQLVVLHQVTHGLLSPDTAPDTLTAINEAAIYAMFRELESLIEVEIDLDENDGPSDHRLRSLAIAAYRQRCQEDQSHNEFAEETLPTVETTDIDCWCCFVEMIADQILWDRDFEFEHLVADIPPEKARQLKQHLGINNDYYSAAAPDVPDIDIAAISEKIRQLTPARG